METIPLIDFKDFYPDDRSRQKACAEGVRRALESHGFLYLRNHGVPEAVIKSVFSQSREFFSLPQDVKNAARPSEKGSTRGYEGVGLQALDEGRPGDLKEIFQAGPENSSDRPNVWPEGLTEFRAALMTFFSAANQACNRLMRAIAVALGLPENHFEPFYDRNNATLRLLHYPPISGTPTPGQLRAGAHTDFGGMNLLFQDDEGGLEIQSVDGRWIPAPALPGTAIVNTGDLIQRWSNGMFRSSPHRVVNPNGPAAARDRYSVVLFHSPNPDAIISCLEPCSGPERPPRFAPISAGEHLRARAQASRRHGY